MDKKRLTKGVRKRFPLSVATQIKPSSILGIGLFQECPDWVAAHYVQHAPDLLVPEYRVQPSVYILVQKHSLTVLEALKLNAKLMNARKYTHIGSMIETTDLARPSKTVPVDCIEGHNLHSIQTRKRKQNWHPKLSRFADHNHLTQEEAGIINDDGYNADDESNANDNNNDYDSTDLSGSTLSAHSKDDSEGLLNTRNTAGGDYVFSRSDLGASLDSSVLDAFPANWRCLIVRASQIWRRHVALVQPFSQSHTQWAKVKKFVSKILDKKAAADQDKIRAIQVLVFESGLTILGAIKTKATHKFQTYYRKILCPEYEHENQEGYWPLIAENVENALRGQAFLWQSDDRYGPPDHPAIEALLIDFFYGGDGCLAASFPDEFSHTVPKCALALAMTCIQNCLEEYFTGYQINIPFTQERFERVHTIMLRSIVRNTGRWLIWECKAWENGPQVLGGFRAGFRTRAGI